VSHWPQKDCVLSSGSTNTGPELGEREIAKHEMARGAGGESVMSNDEGHQRRVQNFSEDELGERDQTQGQMKHVVN